MEFNLFLGICFFLLNFKEFVLATAKIETNGTETFPNLFDDPHLDDWIPPKELRKLTYYWSGIDDECRPIWVIEMGKWDVRKILEQGPAIQPAMLKLIAQSVHQIRRSIKGNETGCGVAKEFIGLVDMDGFNYRQVYSLQTVDFFLKIFHQLFVTAKRAVYKIFAVNVNPAARALFQAGKPILGDLVQRIELFGTNRVKWLPLLLRELPQDQLSPKFGGPKNHKPIRFYGSS